MKNIFSLVVISFLAMSTLLGQKMDKSNLELRVRVPDLVVAPNIGLEYLANKRFGVELNTGIRTGDSYIFSHFDNDGGETDFYTIIAGKFYLKPRHGTDRLYIGTYGLYEYDKMVVLYEQETLENRIIVGGLSGYKFLLAKRFSIDFTVGTGFGTQLTKTETFTGTNTSDIVVNQTALNFYMLGSLNLGFRF